MLELKKVFFRQKLSKYRENLFCLAYSWCNDKDTASDLTQESLEKALKKRDQLSNPNAIKSWLAKILANCWKDFLRKQKDTETYESLAIPSSSNTEHEHERMEIVQRVRESIANLPLNQRQIITLVDIFELSYSEVASTLDIPIGTVMSRVSRARAALRNQLMDYGDYFSLKSTHTDVHNLRDTK